MNTTHQRLSLFGPRDVTVGPVSTVTRLPGPQWVLWQEILLRLLTATGMLRAWHCVKHVQTSTNLGCQLFGILDLKELARLGLGCIKFIMGYQPAVFGKSIDCQDSFLITNLFWCTQCFGPNPTSGRCGLESWEQTTDGTEVQTDVISLVAPRTGTVFLVAYALVVASGHWNTCNIWSSCLFV